MKKLGIALDNCHGIRQLETTLPFKKGNAVSIYAPNGTMKTSFARTFSELAQGSDTKDRMFPDRETVRSITDEGGNELAAGDVVVVLSYDEELGPTESTSTLLVNPGLRKEYESLQIELLTARDELVIALKEQAKTRKDVLGCVSEVFTGQPDGFFLALVRMEYEIGEQDTAPFADVPYDVLFNDKVLPILHTPDLQAELAAYVSRLNDLLDESSFFSRDSFTFYNAANVTRSLGDNGFFTAEHSLLLHGEGGESHPIASKADLDALIATEKERITDDETLRKKLDALEKALNKNVDTRNFFDYISQHVELLPEFVNLEVFEQNLWKSYIKTHEDLYGRVVSCYKDSESERRRSSHRRRLRVRSGSALSTSLMTASLSLSVSSLPTGTGSSLGKRSYSSSASSSRKASRALALSVTSCLRS